MKYVENLIGAHNLLIFCFYNLQANMSPKLDLSSEYRTPKFYFDYNFLLNSKDSDHKKVILILRFKEVQFTNKDAMNINIY